MKAKDKQIGGKHYKALPIEPWDVVDTWPLEQRIGYYRGNAMKYVMRMGAKDEVLIEVGKVIHYLEKLSEVLSEEKSNTRQNALHPDYTGDYTNG